MSSLIVLAVAIVTSDRRVLGEVIMKQDDIHTPWRVRIHSIGSNFQLHLTHSLSQGIVPKLAAQAHQERMDIAISEVMKQAGFTSFDSLDGLAFTRGPGLSICLDVALKKIRELSAQYNLQTVPVNHMEGHLLAARLEDESISLPYLCLLVSGGHSQIVAASGVGEYKILGETLDIALGDAYDKVARALGICDLNGGRPLELRALQGRHNAVPLPIPLKKYKNCDFSFSGLQTAIDVEIERRSFHSRHEESQAHQKMFIPPSSSKKRDIELTPEEVSDFAASFQNACTEHLIDRLKIAIKWADANNFSSKTLVISGGVACNNAIFNSVSERLNPIGYRVVRPSASLCSDNAVMIGWAAQENIDAGKQIISPEEMAELRYIPRWSLDESGVDYFPDSHPSHASTPITVHREATLAKHLEALESSNSPSIVVKVCRSYLSLGNIEKAHEFLQKGLADFKEDPYLEKMALKIIPRYESWRNKYA